MKKLRIGMETGQEYQGCFDPADGPSFSVSVEALLPSLAVLKVAGAM